MIEFFGTIDSALIMHANQVTLGFSPCHLAKKRWHRLQSVCSVLVKMAVSPVSFLTTTLPRFPISPASGSRRFDPRDSEMSPEIGGTGR
jgi:hypothetical protein